MWHKSLGDICKTRFWISLERRPFRLGRWGVSFGPTYVGTKRGLVIMTPWVVVVGHERDLGYQDS